MILRRIEIQLLGGFVITVNGQTDSHLESLALKSRKGVSLLTYLILQRGKPVSTQRLIRELWSTKNHVSPANSLKAMISRLRALLNSIEPGLGACIASDKNAYFWQDLPDVYVDVLEFMDLAERLRQNPPEDERQTLYHRALDVYRGDLFQTGDLISGDMQASWLHREFLSVAYAYVDFLKEREEFNEIVRVCNQALRLDELDEVLRIELMRAMVSLNRADDAAMEYRRITLINRRMLDEDPSEDLKKSYREITEAGRTLKFNLDVIRNELLERENERHGPFFCDYAAFKEIYNIQMRNLERLGSTMFLAMITVSTSEDADSDISAVRRESAMAGLQEIMRNHLRKGDIVTRFAPSIFALLLPTVNYGTGAMVMERMEQLFYDEYPSRKVVIYHRISPLGGLIKK